MRSESNTLYILKISPITSTLAEDAIRNHVCYAHRWLSLPVELLLRVLALLDEQELMTARLVCREWRMASLTFMTHLNLNAWLQNAGMEASTASLKALAKCSQLLPNLKSLACQLEYPEDATLLGLPSCSSALKRLHIRFWECDFSVGPVAFAMAPIARLRGLTLFNSNVPLRSFPVQFAQFVSSASLILAQCTGLCKVNLDLCEAEDWLLLLPLLAGLPHLRLLGDLLLCDQKIVAVVASMTQLTFVHGSDGFCEGMHLQPIFQLPALRALHLNVEIESNWPALVSAAAQGMPQLEHFAMGLYCCAPGSSEFGCLLAPLSGLTKLELGGLNWPPLPHTLWQSCLSNLQELRWNYALVGGGGVALPLSLRHLELGLADWDSPGGGGVALPLSLRHLELGLADWDSPEMPGLVQGVAALTRLTALSLSIPCPEHGWATDGRSNAIWRAASFLTGLTRLVHLELDHFLHLGNVEGDVECLAVLTGLRSLSLWGSCACHGGKELYLQLVGRRDQHGWRVGACGFEAFEAQGGFLRLLPLAGLKVLGVEGPWEVLKGSTLVAEVNAVKRSLGRPPLKLDSVFRWQSVGYRTPEEGF